MPTVAVPAPEDCNCFAVRSAARHVTQLYDQLLAPVGLRVTQFSILARLRSRGPLTINALAEDMVMDRTTLGRNIQPLERFLELLPSGTIERPGTSTIEITRDILPPRRSIVVLEHAR